MTRLQRSPVVAARWFAPLSCKGFRHSARRGRISPLGWSLLPGAPALTRTGLTPARTIRLSGRTISTILGDGCASVIARIRPSVNSWSRSRWCFFLPVQRPIEVACYSSARSRGLFRTARRPHSWNVDSKSPSQPERRGSDLYFQRCQNGNIPGSDLAFRCANDRFREDDSNS